LVKTTRCPFMFGPFMLGFYSLKAHQLIFLDEILSTCAQIMQYPAFYGADRTSSASMPFSLLKTP